VIDERILWTIPSRGRAEILAAKTLPLLRRLGVDPLRTKVYVAPEEIADYRRTLAIAGFGLVRICRGALGGVENRNAILDATEEGTRTVSIDDDLRDLVVRRSEKLLEPVEPDEFAEIVATGFDYLDSTPARIFGLYAVPNPFFMKPRWRTELCYLGGAFTGYYSSRDPDSPLRVSYKYKHDFERSLRCYVADGMLVRCDYVSWRTEGYRGSGGLQSDGDRAAVMPEIVEALAREFPGLAHPNYSKKSGWPEVRLVDRRATVRS
jgi:hypothetical protein